MTRFLLPLALFILLAAVLAVGIRHSPHQVPQTLNRYQ